MRFALSLVALSLLAGCGDSFSGGGFPQIIVEVESQSVSNDGIASFGQAIQQVVAKSVTVANGGTRALRIDGIDWEVGPDGQRLKNQYVEIDWRGAVDANTFPRSVDVDNRNSLTFAVEFTPPLGKPLDDFADSVLVIKSNAFDDLGREKVTEFRIVFSMRQDSAIPRVTPNAYNFRNATIAKGETQEFRIYNDTDLATSPFKITNVYLETPSAEFTLQNTPSSGTTVLEPGNPGYADVVFKVTYQPKDSVPDTNAIIVQTDVGAGGTLRVPLTSSSSVGDFSISYSHVNELDFSKVTQKETRSVQVTCDGPGTMTIKAPRIEPAEARSDYTVTAWIPASTAGAEDVQVTSWPRGLNVGKAIRFDIEYSPATDGTDTANGQLIIPYENPNVGEIEIQLLSGDPKSKIVLAPKTELVSVTGSVVAGETGTRTVVVYNDGNGPLQVKAARVHADFDLEAKVWSLATAFTPFTVPPGGLALVEVAYDLGAVTDNDGRQVEYLDLTYYDDFLGSDQKKLIGLSAEESKGKSNPVASLGNAADYAGATVGAGIDLSAAGSTAASGAIDSNGYIYYLVAKPAGSVAKLNVQAGASTRFVPDVAGSYSFEMFVYAKDGDLYLYSTPAALTLQVAP